MLCKHPETQTVDWTYCFTSPILDGSAQVDWAKVSSYPLVQEINDHGTWCLLLCQKMGYTPIPDFWAKPYVSYVGSCYDRQPLATNCQLPIYRWFIVGSWYGRSPSFQMSFGFSQPLALHILRKTPRPFLAQAHFDARHIPVPCWSCYKWSLSSIKWWGSCPKLSHQKFHPVVLGNDVSIMFMNDVLNGNFRILKWRYCTI